MTRHILLCSCGPSLLMATGRCSETFGTQSMLSVRAHPFRQAGAAVRNRPIDPVGGVIARRRRHASASLSSAGRSTGGSIGIRRRHCSKRQDRRYPCCARGMADGFSAVTGHGQAGHASAIAVGASLHHGVLAGAEAEFGALTSTTSSSFVWAACWLRRFSGVMLRSTWCHETCRED